MAKKTHATLKKGSIIKQLSKIFRNPNIYICGKADNIAFNR